MIYVYDTYQDHLCELNWVSFTANMLRNMIWMIIGDLICRNCYTVIIYYIMCSGWISRALNIYAAVLSKFIRIVKPLKMIFNVIPTNSYFISKFPMNLRQNISKHCRQLCLLTMKYFSEDSSSYRNDVVKLLSNTYVAWNVTAVNPLLI